MAALALDSEPTQYSALAHTHYTFFNIKTLTFLYCHMLEERHGARSCTSVYTVYG